MNFVSFRKEIWEAVERAIEHFGLLVSRYSVEHPADEAHGDYATNVAMVARESVIDERGAKVSPRELAERLVEFLRNDEKLGFLVEKVEVASPGFINFFLKKGVLVEELERVVDKGGDYGKGGWGLGKRVVVDYSSPNIAKRFGVSHMRSTLIGQAIVNLYRFSGWQVTGDNHLGDWGTQFGMIIAAVEEKDLDISQMTIEDLERIYVSFNMRIETEPELQEKAREAFSRLEKGEEKARKIWQEAMRISLLEFEKVYEQLGVKIEKAYGESFYEDKMEKVIEEVREKGLAKESEGALIMEFDDPSTGSGQVLPPAMLVKSNGTTTYFTRDLATVWYRLFGDDHDMRADLYVYEVGSGQTLHFKQLFEVVEKLGWINKDRLIHVAHGWMRLPEGKMSTRKGNLVKMEELLAEAIKRAVEMADGEMEVAKKVGVGAVIYNELKYAPETDYEFSFDEAMNMDGDSGPYLQYCVVRGRSVLTKAKSDIDNLTFNIDYFGEEEMEILRYLYRFGEVVEVAAKSFSPNLICSYLFELASRFNRFYNREKIIGSERENERLLLTRAVVQVLENGLMILGVKVPERM